MRRFTNIKTWNLIWFDLLTARINRRNLMVRWHIRISRRLKTRSCSRRKRAFLRGFICNDYQVFFDITCFLLVRFVEFLMACCSLCSGNWYTIIVYNWSSIWHQHTVNLWSSSMPSIHVPQSSRFLHMSIFLVESSPSFWLFLFYNICRVHLFPTFILSFFLTLSLVTLSRRN